MFYQKQQHVFLLALQTEYLIQIKLKMAASAMKTEDSALASQCTMAQALKKFGIKDLAKMMTLAPIFSS